MGAGKSRMNLKKCSCDELRDLGSPRVHTEFHNCDRNDKNFKDELCKHPNKYVLSRMSRMTTNNSCICNTTLIENKYSLDALTAEEQLDEVEQVFREKKRGRAGRQKKRCTNNAPPSICCNCACTCDGGQEPQPHKIERRNGLQKVDRCNGACQCVLCCENMRDARMGELCEAEAIAEAIREFCCKERERARGGGKSRCKCCACTQRQQMIEEDEYDDDEEEEEEEVVERKRVIKQDIVIEERIQSKRGEDELTDDESIEESAARQRRKSFESAVLNPENGKRSSIDQKHAKSCKCCKCRKEVAADTDIGSDTYGDIISLDNIELEVQTDMISTRRDQWEKKSPTQSRRQSEENTAKTNKCCTCDKGTTTDDSIHDAKVLMKRRSLRPESTEGIKPTPSRHSKEQRRRSIDEEAMPKPQRRLSEEPRSEKPTPHAKGCKCCQCTRKNREIANSSDAETNSRPIRRQSQTDREPERRSSLPRRSVEDNTSRRRSVEYDEPKIGRETQPRREWRRGSQQQQDEMAMPAARQPRRQPQSQEPRTPMHTPSRNSSCCECKPRDRRVECENTDQQSERESDSEEERKQQRCYCFNRKKSQRCRKDCSCNKKQAAKSHNRGKRSSSEPSGAGSEPRQPPRRRRNSEQAASNNKDKDCQADCTCKKTKGVPLTKCCKCTDTMVESMERKHEEDMKRRKLAEVLADRLQKRAELQIALQKRLQQQMGGKPKQQRCCCQSPPFCMPAFPCCEPMPQTEPIPINCCEPPPCCCQPTPCCFETPPCCYEPPPCYGHECPCCCQSMPFCYSASCSYPKPGSC